MKKSHRESLSFFLSFFPFSFFLLDFDFDGQEAGKVVSRVFESTLSDFFYFSFARTKFGQDIVEKREKERASEEERKKERK